MSEAWVSRIALHKTIDLLRTKIQARAREQAFARLSVPPETDPELGRLLHARTAALPPRLRGFYVLHYEQGLSEHEIAARLASLSRECSLARPLLSTTSTWRDAAGEGEKTMKGLIVSLVPRLQPRQGWRAVLVPLLLWGISWSMLPEEKPAGVSVATKVVPRSFVDGEPVQIYVTLKADSLKGVRLQTVAPPGFVVDRPLLEFSLTYAGTEATEILNVYRRAGAPVAAGNVAIVIRILVPRNGSFGEVAAQVLEVEYAPQLATTTYLVLGCVGIFLGYGLRFLVKALSEAGPVAAAQALRAMQLSAPPVTEPIKAFVLRHYVLVDLTVTLLIGLLVLVSMMQQGRPPQGGAFWHSSLVLGTGLGFLTNSDLLLKIR